MTTQEFSGEELIDALAKGLLARRDGVVLMGMVKSSENEGFINFTQGECETWVELPAEAIDKAEVMGHRICKDHSHPVVRIHLSPPKDAPGNIYLALLSQVVQESEPSQAQGPGFATTAAGMRHLPAAHGRGHLPMGPMGTAASDADVALRAGSSGGGGYCACVGYYPCGTCADGSVMMCSDCYGCISVCTDVFLPTVSTRPNWQLGRSGSTRF